MSVRPAEGGELAYNIREEKRFVLPFLLLLLCCLLQLELLPPSQATFLGTADYGLKQTQSKNGELNKHFLSFTWSLGILSKKQEKSN